NVDISNGNCRETGFNLFPLLTTVIAEMNPGFGSYKKQILIYMILTDGISRTSFGKISSNASPAFSAVCAFQYIRLEVTIFMIVEYGKHGIFIMQRSDYCIHIRVLRYTGKARNFVPVFTAIF